MTTSKSCAFLPCDQVSSCPLDGGCLKNPKRPKAKQVPGRPVEYNPMMGTRLDLIVTAEENGAKVDATWRAGRVKYLEKLLAGKPGATARGCYERELAKLKEG